MAHRGNVRGCMGLSQPPTLRSHTWKSDGWTLNHYKLQYLTLVSWQKMSWGVLAGGQKLLCSVILTSELPVSAGQLGRSSSRLSQSGRVPEPVCRIDGCHICRTHSKPLNESSESTQSHIQHMYIQMRFLHYLQVSRLRMNSKYSNELSEDQRLKVVSGTIQWVTY